MSTRKYVCKLQLQELYCSSFTLHVILEITWQSQDNQLIITTCILGIGLGGITVKCSLHSAGDNPWSPRITGQLSQDCGSTGTRTSNSFFLFLSRYNRPHLCYSISTRENVSLEGSKLTFCSTSKVLLQMFFFQQTGKTTSKFLI